MDRSACAQYEDGLIPWAEGETLPDDVDRGDFEAHLEECRRCHASVSAFRRVLGELRNDAPPETPPPEPVRRHEALLRRLNPVHAFRALTRRWRTAGSRR